MILVLNSAYQELASKWFIFLMCPIFNGTDQVSLGELTPRRDSPPLQRQYLLCVVEKAKMKNNSMKINQFTVAEFCCNCNHSKQSHPAW